MSKILYNRASKLFMDKVSQGYDEMGAHAAVEKKYGIRLADTILGDARAEMKAIKGNPRTKKWDGDTSSGSEYSDLRGRWGLSHNDAVAVIEGSKTFQQVRSEWEKRGQKLEPLYDLRRNPRGRHRYLDWKKQTEEAAEELAERKRKPTEEEYYQGNPRNPNKIEIGKIVDDENGIEKMVVVEKGHPGRTNYRVFAEPTKKGKETKAYREIRSKMGDDWFSDITDSWWEHGTLPKKMQEKIDKHIEELKALGYTRY